MNYLIVLFKNKKRKKIIKSFVRKNKAELFFNKCVDESDRVNFEISVENAKKVTYEISIVSILDDTQMLLFKQDDMGRNVKIEMMDSDYKIIKLQNYNIPEKLFDWKQNKRITFEEFCLKYLDTSGLKNIFTINNKIVVQNDELVDIFSLKNKNESKRFISVLQNYMINKKRADAIFVSDSDTIHRKYLYKLLVDNGFDKKKLYRQSTTFSERK